MLHLFRRVGLQDGVPMDGVAGVVVSHILAKFLKRLRHMEKPRLLDLGRLSGSNIEFFAQRGCRVQVEDLMLSLEGTSAGPAGSEAGAGHEPGEDRPAEHGIVRATDSPVAPPFPGVTPTTPALPRVTMAAGTASSGSPAPAARPGARPSRRIVLPPRTFASSAARTRPETRPIPPRSGAPEAAALSAALPTRFDYPDETFDAILAWDICNYYAPGAMRLMASEARRILKPGGLLLGYFHARRAVGPGTPRRYRVLDETHVACDEQPGPPLERQVYQNRDIEKMFAGLTIVELYFLKNATREILMEKKSALAAGARTLVRPATPKARFTIE